MTLPKIETPTHELTLPSANVQVKYRPFTIGEEKILLQALETGTESSMQQALKDIVNACTFGALDGGTMPTFDLEYVFLQIRAKSVGEVAKLRLLCPDDKETYGEAEIDLTKVDVQVDDKHTNKIVIDEKRNFGLLMKYPTIDSISPRQAVAKLKTNELFDMIANCIKEVYDGEKVFKVEDYSKEELHSWFESMNKDTFNQINAFFDTMPALEHTIYVTNPKTKVENKTVLKGAQDFFGLPSLTKA